MRYVTPVLLAGAAATAILMAPAASAEPCQVTGQGGGYEGGSTTVCSSPGNVQIDSRPSVYAQPWYGETYLGVPMMGW